MSLMAIQTWFLGLSFYTKILIGIVAISAFLGFKK